MFELDSGLLRAHSVRPEEVETPPLKNTPRAQRLIALFRMVRELTVVPVGMATGVMVRGEGRRGKVPPSPPT